MNRRMTLNETADYISNGLPDWQRNANLNFLEHVHRSLKDDGVWVYKATGKVFVRTDDGFEIQLDH